MKTRGNSCFMLLLRKYHKMSCLCNRNSFLSSIYRKSEEFIVPAGIFCLCTAPVTCTFFWWTLVILDVSISFMTSFNINQPFKYPFLDTVQWVLWARNIIQSIMLLEYRIKLRNLWMNENLFGLNNKIFDINLNSYNIKTAYVSQ